MLALGNHALHRCFDAARRSRRRRLLVPAPEPGEQHLARHDHGVGIGDVAARNVGCRAVGRLRHGLTLPHAQTRRKAEPADEPGANVREDVAELVRRHDDVELLRRGDELHGDGVDHHLLECHVGIVARHLAAFLREHAAGEAIDGLLVRGSDLLSRSGAGDLERFARNAVGPLAGDHPHCDRDVVVGAEFGKACDDRLGIKHSLRELAQEYDVHVLVDGGNAGMGERRPHRGEKIESFAHRRHDPGAVAPGIGSMPDRSHDPPMELVQALLGHARESMTVLLVSALADRKRPPFEIEPLLCRGRLHHLDAFRNDFGSDVVAEQDADLQARAPAHAIPSRHGAIGASLGSGQGIAQAAGVACSLVRGACSAKARFGDM